MKDIKMVVFDCDGVMFDTAEVNKAFYNGILTHFGKPKMTDAQFEYVHMHTVKEAVKNLFLGCDNIEEVMAYKDTIDYTNLIPYMTMEHGLKELLRKLRPRKKTAVATNRMNTMPLVIKEHDLGDLFDMVVMASHVENPKPAPDMLFKIASEFKLSPENGVFIGDSILDGMAARAAGMTFIAYKSPELEADIHANGFDELHDLLLA